MKRALFALFFLVLPLFSIAQFGAEYSSYGFNFVNDTYNNGLYGWQGNEIGNTAKLNIYKEGSLNDYVLEFKAQNETVSISYDDSGYIDLNPCSLIVNLRLRIPQYTGNQDGFAFSLYTGSKWVNMQFKNTGIYYLNETNTPTLITAAPILNQWVTYTISLDDCLSAGGLMIENDVANIFPLSFPDNAANPSIEMYAHTDGSTEFETEVDHLMIYSNPTKWWLEHSTSYIDETNYVGTTGDRHHFLSLPNGERIGVNENAGGLITFTELYTGGPNLDPRPKFGSGGTKTIRCYFHTNKFNPVQAGISSTSGGHLATVTSTPGVVNIESFPLHSYLQNDFTENSTLVYPSGDILYDENVTEGLDDDIYDEFGLDMRHELLSELDFNTKIEDASQTNGISVVRHVAEWEYIRHSSHVLQFHEVETHRRPTLNGTSGTDVDMGDMRHKFEFRLNKDLDYEWVFWRENGAWQSQEFLVVEDSKTIVINSSTPIENRFLVFSTSNSINDVNSVAWYYPESSFNVNSSLGKSRVDKSVLSGEDRRYLIRIVADWRKTNWCRMNLYCFNEGLEAPQNGNPNVYESFQMEAYQLFGSPAQILAEIQNITLPIELISFDVEATNQGQVLLQWTTANEVNNDFFTIERSQDGTQWEAVKKVSGLESSIETMHYTNADEKPYVGLSFYRLKQTDKDGSFSYSDIKSVVIENDSKDINIFPNPTANILHIDLNGIIVRDLSLVNALGKDLTTEVKTVSKNEDKIILDLSGLSRGIYYLIINNDIKKKVQKGL